jgi:uncharacterized membrane protein
MTVLILLLAAWLIFRGCGALGVYAFATWHDSARYALALMFVFTAIAHFNRVRHDLVKMVPAFLPRPLAVIYATGALELLGAAGLLLPHTERLSALCLILLLIAMFPANIKAAREGLTLHGKPATVLWLRVPMQIFFIALLWWSTRDNCAAQRGKLRTDDHFVGRVGQLKSHAV